VGWGQQSRNDFRGPRFFDMDLSLTKTFTFHDRVSFTFGAQAFNLLNHPSFDKPVNDIADPSFGSIIGLATPPTSLLGAFFGAGASPRFVQLQGQVRF
jgi:hypothetical protein